MAYNLNDVATITGLTTRTLRNYLKQDLLTGEKIDGNWSFTDEELEAFMSNPVVKQAIKTKRNAVVYPEARTLLRNTFHRQGQPGCYD